MRNLRLRFKARIIQILKTSMIAILVIGLFGTAAYAQITATTSASRCGAGVVVLHATGSGTIKWYTVPFYGTPITTGLSDGGATFTTPSLAVTATYYVDAVNASNCSVNTNSTRVPVIATINANSVQAIIFYASNTYCKGADGVQSVIQTGTAGGTFSASPSGLAITPSTGAITPSSSTNGDYTVTYNVTAAPGCVENPAITSVTITNGTVTPVISYSGSPYCTTSAPVTVSQTAGATGGTYSASPSGLTIDPGTGTITPSTSLSGNYTITYFVSSAGGCAPQTATAIIDVLQLPTASISYATPICNGSGSHSVTLTGTGVYKGGIYSAPAGLNIDASTGVITTPCTAGTYTVTYTLAAVSPCAQVTATTSVTINPLSTAVLSGSADICRGGTAGLSIALTGAQPWSFTYTDGGTPVTVTGQTTSPYTFNLSPVTTTTYTLTEVNDVNCVGTTSGSALVTVSPAQVATFEYSGSPYCSNGTNPPPNMLGVGTLGTFSSTSGLVFVSPTTGVINLSASTAGTYTVTNTIAATGGCPEVTATASVTITKLPSADFTYTSAAYCTNVTNPAPIMGTGAVTGMFSSTGGLQFVEITTGEINLSASTPGNYTITNTIAAANGCGVVIGTYGIEIKAIPAAATGTGTSICLGSSTQLGAAPIGSNTYSWTSNVGGFTSTLANPTVSPTETTIYTLVESNGFCSNTHNVTVGVTAQPAANPIIGTAVLCAGSTLVAYHVTTDNTNSNALYEWAYSGAGATLSSLTDPSNTISFDAASATSGDLTVIENINGCTTTNHFAVTVNPLPTAMIGGTTAVCQHAAAPDVTFTGAAGTAPYTFTYKINGGSDLTITTNGGNSSVTVPSPTTTSGTYTYALVSVQDASATHCSQTQTGSEVVTVNPLPDAPAAGNLTITYDGSEHAGTATPQAGASVVWYAANSGGSAIVAPHGTNSGSYMAWAESVVDATGCKSATRTQVTVTIDKAGSTIVVTGSASYIYTGLANGPVASTVEGSTGAVTYSYSGTGSTTYGASATAPTNVGTYKVTASVAPDANHNGAVSADYNFTINKAVLTVTADNNSKNYDGSGFSSFTSTITGYVHSENISVVTGSVTYDGDATTAVNGGSYTIIPVLTELSAVNYSFTPVNGTLTINRVAIAITVTATGPAKEYGTTLTIVPSSATSFTATPTGVGTEAVTNVTLTPDAAGLSASTPAGTAYSVTPSAAEGQDGFLASNYNITYIAFSGIVSTKAITVISASVTTKTYNGDAVAAITGARLSGVLTGDLSFVTLGNATTGTFNDASVGSGKAVATAPMTISGTKAVNYSLTQPTLTGAITAKALTVTATGPAKEYGTALTAGTSASNFTFGGATTGEVVTSATLTPDPAGLSATTAAGAAYVVTPSLATGTGGFLASNYNITYTAYNGTVAKRNITLTSATNTKTFDGGVTAAALPTITSGSLASGDVGTYTETYENALVGIGKTMIPAVVSILNGSDDMAGNYTVTLTNSANGTVTIEQTLAPTVIAPIILIDGNSKGYVQNNDNAIVNVQIYVDGVAKAIIVDLATGSQDWFYVAGQNAVVGSKITAKAYASGKSMSVLSNAVTVTGPATLIVINAGDGQSVTEGYPVPIAPSVIVKDANNNPVSGVSVNFAVATGGGSVTGFSATTDASGIATVGSWTLGSTAGSNTLTATSGSLTGSPVTFTATGN